MSTTRKRTILAESTGLRSYIQGVFARMSAGLFLTAIVAYVVAASPQAMHAIFQTPLFYVVLFAPLGIALFLQARIETLSKEAATGLFFTYAATIGISLASIFMVYSLPSIAQTFLTTATLFGVMSYYGYITQADLTKFGSFLKMGLIGLIISSIISMFMKSSAIEFALSIIGSLIFVGLTAYDMQRIKLIYSEIDDDEMQSKKMIIGALVLYLDFINLFLFLLRLMGKRNKN